MQRFPSFRSLVCAFHCQTAPPPYALRAGFRHPSRNVQTAHRISKWGSQFGASLLPLLLLGASVLLPAQTATPSATFLSFTSAPIGVSGGSAQTLTASFAVSGYTGSFTPTATLHYGHDYSLGAVNCIPSGASETCTVAVTFQPTLPGARKDAIFLMNGSTRLATVLLNGVGQGPFALLQPGVFATSVPTNNYIYQSVVDENGTVYLLANGNSGYITSVNKAGVATKIPIDTATTHAYLSSIGIDGAGVVYLFTENDNVITYDTVQGTQGAYNLPIHGALYVFPGTVGNSGSLYAVDQDTQVLYQFKPDGTTATTPITPSVNQDYTITVDSSDNVFIGGYTIDKVTSAGVVSKVNTVGASDGLAVDAAGTLYATRYTGGGSVAELAASDYSTPIALIDPTVGPLGVSVGSDGTVFVSNYVNLDVYDRHVSQTSSSIDFGQVAAGQTSTSNLGQIYNGGNEALTISALSLAGDAFTLQTGGSSGCSAGGEIAPGALCQMSIVFAPTHAGKYTGTVTVNTNSLNSTGAIQNLVVQGETYGAYVTVSPSPAAFGSQTVGTTSTTLSETITNAGYGVPISVGTPTSTSTAFSVTPGTCTAQLAVGASCQLYLTFSPTAAQSYNGTISVPYNSVYGGSAITATLAVTGTGTGTPAASISPAGPLAFGNQTVNTTSATQTLTLSNPGGAALNISSIAIAGANPTDFAQTNNCGASLAAGANCAIQVSFTPASVASFGATVAVTDNATGSPQSVALTGTGTAVPVPVVSLAPTSLTFTATTGTTSPAQTATLTNSGNAALNISSIAIGGANPAGFSQTNNCPASLAAGASCNISITFAPASVASYNAALVVSDNASGSPHTVALGGTGTAAPAPVAVLTPASLSLGSIAVGGSSPVQTATLKNTGNATLNITGITLAGANPTDFALTNTCGTSLAAGANCAISITFTPASAATFSATLQVADNSTGSPQTAALTGTGTVPPAPVATLAPTSVAFSSETTGTTSAPTTVTLTNSGNAALSITSIAIGGTNPTDFAQTNTCGASLAAGTSCAFSVTFTPASAASFSATLQVADSATGSPQTVALSGSGVAPADFGVSGVTPASQTVQPGGSAAFNVTVTSSGGTFSNPVVLTVSGLPAGGTGSFSPSSVTPGSASSSSTLTVQTSTARAQTERGSAWPLAAPVLAVAGLFFLPGKRHRKWITLGLLLVASLGTLTALSGCGGGFRFVQPAQNYTLTITGTSGNDTHSTTVQLTVE